MIVQTILEIKSGRKTLLEAIPEGADPAFWQRLVDNYSPAKAKRRTPRRRAGSASRKTNHAARVIGRAMAELVERVNGSEDEQTFASGPEWFEDDDPIVATIEARDFYAHQHQSGRVSYNDKAVAQ